MKAELSPKIVIPIVVVLAVIVGLLIWKMSGNSQDTMSPIPKGGLPSPAGKSAGPVPQPGAK